MTKVILPKIIFSVMGGVVYIAFWVRSFRIKFMKGYAESHDYMFTRNDRNGLNEKSYQILDFGGSARVVNNVVQHAYDEGVLYLFDRRTPNGRNRQTVCLIEGEFQVKELVQIRRRLPGKVQNVSRFIGRVRGNLSEVRIPGAVKFEKEFSVFSEKPEFALYQLDDEFQERFLKLLSRFPELPLVVAGIRGRTLAICTGRLSQEDDLEYLSDLCRNFAIRLRQQRPV